MNTILTLVASDSNRPVLDCHIENVRSCFPDMFVNYHWLAAEKAVDIHLSGRPDVSTRMALESYLGNDKIDFFVLSADETRKKKLLVADMDSTMVIGETLDELAAQCGLKEEVAVITDLAMRGELDFQDALQQRVEMLQGLAEETLRVTLETIQPMPGAELLVATMRRYGAKCVLASGGFSCFTGPIGEKIGFHNSHGNTLEISGGRLTGRVVGAILDHNSKLSFLQHYQQTLELDPADTLAVGDGANDLAMISAAGLGVGFHPKPFLKDRVENNILHGDLTALLYAQGYEDFL